MNEWRRKWQVLKDSAKKKGSICSLTLDEYVSIAKESGLTSPTQIGRSNTSYHMGRIGDEGIYERGNCRFISHSQNREEKLNNGKERKKSIDRIKRKAADRIYVLRAPDGKVHEFNQLTDFCKEHELHISYVSQLNNRKKSSYKGWTVV